MSTEPTGGEAGPAKGAPGAAATDALTLPDLARELASPTRPTAESWRPVPVRVAPGEREGLAAACAGHGLVLLDPIERQLADLAAVRLPAGGAADRQRFVADTVDAAGGAEAVGAWMWLPWDRKVVHVLGPDDFHDVITDRNRDKITREEQRLLGTRRVGVVGLSVGGEGAVTLAQEHLCGEIVLADFDALDLSNLNRLNAGIDELGVNKAVIAARRIARIDPWLGVTIFPEGVTAENLDRFLDGLDLLVEECDGLAMKWEMRQRARERALNVIFAADERGFLSVEPYGLEPDLQPFHGWVDGPQRGREAFDDPRDFMKELCRWMGGWDAISERSRASLERLGDTLVGYPQLAGEARYAAGLLGHVARCLLLGRPVPAFVGHLDPAGLVPGTAMPAPTPE